MLEVSPMFGLIVHEIEAGFIGSLNVTVIGEACGTPTSPSRGFVLRICGGTQCARNCHGFGFEPVTLTRLLFPVSFADTVTVYSAQSVNDPEWVTVTMVFPPDQEGGSVPADGLTDMENVAALAA